MTTNTTTHQYYTVSVCFVGSIGEEEERKKKEEKEG